MRILLLITMFVAIAISSNAQVASDSVSLGGGYGNQSFYSLDNGEVANVDNTNWELAFDVSGFGSALRINGSKGVELYVYPNADTSAWNTALDTSSIGGWTQLYDSDTSWAYGAGNSSADPNDPFDLGWGTYNPTTHIVTGDSLFVMKLGNGALKKLHIIRLGSGSYEFRHADLDGSNAVNNSLSKSSYAGKNYVYYSLTNDQLIDREPAASDWDIVFTSYVGSLGPGVWYGVTGALHNQGVTVAEAGSLSDPGTYTNYSAHTFSSEINTIGYDWKTFNMSTFSFDLDDSLAYFISDQDGKIWRMVFYGFAGNSTGNINFDKELVATVNRDAETTIKAFELFPNPSATGGINVVFDLRARQAELNIRDLSGRIVRQMEVPWVGFHNLYIPLQDLQGGMYIVTLSTKSGRSTQKLILR